MNRYRVYIKQARPNILGNLILYSQPGYESDAHADSDYIPVDNLHSYELKKIQGSQVKIYNIFEYDSEKTAIVSNPLDITVLDGGHIHVDESVGRRNRKPYKYIPADASIKYIKIIIMDSDIADTERGIVNSYMFLRSESAILIHDSGAINEKYHLLNATLTLTDNSAGSFEFGVHKKHIYYKTKINLWTDTIYITRTYSDGSERICWDGRCISEQIDSYGNKVYHAEGALSYLSDYRVISNIYNNPYPDYRSSLTVYEFIDSFIIGRYNDNLARSNRMDRSFYYLKNQSNDDTIPDFYKCEEGATIYIDTGSKFEWETFYESGLKWIDDIKSSFDAHFKIRYREYDSPKDDTICRVLTGVQDFYKTYELTKLIFAENKHYNRDVIVYYTYNNEDVKIYKFLTRTYVDLLNDGQGSNEDKIRYGLAQNYFTEIDLSQHDEYYIDNGKAYFTLSGKRLSKIHAKFGTDIFSATKTSDIINFATRIIPKGAEFEDKYGVSHNIYLNYDCNINSSGEKTGEYISNTSIWLEDLSLIKQYGSVSAIVTFEDAKTTYELRTQATKWFQNIKKEIISKNIEISLTTLFSSIIPGSSDPLADDEYLDIWTQVIAEIPELGITAEDPEKYYISSVSIPLDNYLNTTITLSNLSKNISDNAIRSGDIQTKSEGIIDSSS